MMDSITIRSTLQQLASGHCQPSEQAALLQQLQQASEAGTLDQIFPAEEWKQIMPLPVDQEELDRVFANIMLDHRARSKRVIMRRWWYAAAVCVLVTAAAFAWLLPGNQQQDELSSNISWQRISTAEGKMQKISLEDGSVVYVNGGSVLDIPRNFSSMERRFKLLQGELFIEAAPDATRPMIADLNGLEVKVLGTSFNLRNYPDEPLATVSVLSGKVAARFSGSDSSLLLAAGHSVRWNKAAHTLELHQFLNNPSGWLNHEFRFDGEPLEQVLKNLQHAYGVPIILHDSILAKRPVKASFKAQSLNNILRILGKMGAFTLLQDAQIIHIYPAEPIQQKNYK